MNLNKSDATSYYRLMLGTPADLERSELDVVSFVLISDVDALDLAPEDCGP